MLLDDLNVAIDKNHLKLFCDNYIVYRDAFNIKKEREFFKNKLVEKLHRLTPTYVEVKSLKSHVLAPDARITNTP